MLVNNENFVEALNDLLEVDSSTLDPNIELESLGQWDSLTIVSLIALIDQYFNKKVSGDDIFCCHSLSDLRRLIDTDN